MKVINTLIILIFFFTAGYSQQVGEKLQAFEVTAGGASVEGINVVNLSTEKFTVTDAAGKFKLPVKAGDLVVLTAVHLEYHRIIIEEEDLRNNFFSIKMIPKVTELKETLVNANSHINAERLGIIPAGQKKYTAAERRLKTAGDFEPIHLIGLLGGAVAVDPIINAITGKTKRLKKEISVEKKEQMLEKLFQLPDAYYIDKLQISKSDIPGFQYFVIEYTDIENILQSNSTAMNFALAELAVEYNQIMNGDNK